MYTSQEILKQRKLKNIKIITHKISLYVLKSSSRTINDYLLHYEVERSENYNEQQNVNIF